MLILFLQNATRRILTGLPIGLLLTLTRFQRDVSYLTLAESTATRITMTEQAATTLTLEEE